jgi:hypothetical protein
MTDQEAADFALEQIKKYDAQLKLYQEQHPEANGRDHGNGADDNNHSTSSDGGTSITPAAYSESKIENDVIMSYAGNDDLPATGSGSGTGNASTDKPEHHISSEIAVPKNENDVMYLVSKALVQEALDRRSLDNVTVMMIKL